MNEERQKRKEIGGRTYQFMIPPAMQGISICTRAGVLIGPLVTSLFNKKDVDSKSFVEAVSQADPDKLNALMMDAWRLSKLHCEGQPVSDNVGFEKHFSQYPADTYPVLLWILWETVTPFFPDIETFAQKFSMNPKDGQSPFPMPGARNGG